MTKSQNKPQKHACARSGCVSLPDEAKPLPFGIWDFVIWDFFGIWDFGIWNLLGRAPLKTATALCACLLAITLAHAQTSPELVVIVDQTPIVIEAPQPFVEVSRILPEAYAKSSRTLPPANRLLAWFIPELSLKEQLNETTARYRSLQVQVLKEMEPVRYDSKSFATLRAQTLAAHPMPQITEAGADTLFSVLNLSPLTQEAGGQKILGMADLGADTFTLCIAASTEGSDRRGGREIETSVACVTYMFIKGKVLLLAVTGPELTAKELRNSIRLSREWVKLLRERNPTK